MFDIGSFVTIKESVKLPSLGMVYGVQLNPNITIRSMTNQEDLILTGYAENEYKKICDVLDACIEDKLPISTYDMCIGDYEYLLHKLRIVTYGNNYPLTIQCPNCGEVVRSNINLDDLLVNEFDEKAIGDRLITLPITKLTIRIGFQTPKSLDLIKEKAKEKKRLKGTPGVNYNMLYEAMSFIQTVNGEKVDNESLEELVLKLPAKDARYIIQKGKELNRKVGLDTSVIAKCPECGYEVLTRFQLQPEFFNPNLVDDQ